MRKIECVERSETRGLLLEATFQANFFMSNIQSMFLVFCVQVKYSVDHGCTAKPGLVVQDA